MNILLKVFLLFGGLAFFMYGMNVLSAGLSKLAGGSLERSLKKMTSNRFTGMGLGAGITIAIQSSSAMTVMLVGLVNSGIMALGQTIPVIMGSNIGTTLTPWIFSMSGIEGAGWVNLLKPENFSLIVAFIGIIMIMMGKKNKHKDIGAICVGFAVLMYGMKMMGQSVDGLENSTIFEQAIEYLKAPVVGPILGVILGAVVTGVIQSSAASVAMLQALALSGGISYGVAIPIIMGQNIGTCVTAVISSIGVSKNAKKVSIVHITFNLIGTVICLILFYGADAVFNFGFTDTNIDAFGIALVHTIFNVFTTATLCPFNKQLEAIAHKVIRPSKNDISTGAFLDERLLRTPSVAVSEAVNMTGKMANIAQRSILTAIEQFKTYSQKSADAIIKDEDELDNYEDKLGSFLVRLSSSALTDTDSRQVSKILHTIGDFERLGDHAVELLKGAEELREKKLSFSDEAKAELSMLQDAITEILDLTVRAFAGNDRALAQHVEPLEQVVDKLIARAKNNHIERLQSGKCTIKMGFVQADLLASYERISDHCSNIAVAVIETQIGSFDTHQYLSEAKESGSHHFAEHYKVYAQKYGV
ncbi:MAG: Na/Pi cotransporter family protein [Ruminococcaceae bacterium]|nr:Na/Pi cotransporter family protein [Oscillospiraceae bacterium]